MAQAGERPVIFMRSTSAALAVLVLVVAATGATADAGPTVREESDRLVLANEDVTVWFQGKKPLLKVFPTGDESAAFEFRFDRVVEFRDADGDGVASDGEIRAFLNLAAANAWQVETETEENTAVVRLTIEAPLRLRTPTELDVEVPRGVTGNVTLVFHVFAAATDVETPDGPLALRSVDVKYDFLVNAWTWLDAEQDRLALLVDVPADLTLAGDHSAVLEANGTAVGSVAWLASAVATRNGAEETIDVVTETRSENGKARLQHAFAASGFEALAYDPVIAVLSAETADEAAGGLGGALRETPGPAALALLGALAVGAVVVRRRR